MASHPFPAEQASRTWVRAAAKCSPPPALGRGLSLVIFSLEDEQNRLTAWARSLSSPSLLLVEVVVNHPLQVRVDLVDASCYRPP